ncbi:MAG: transketolase [bacterium]|nr:transketolase [bacterium]
MSGLIADNALLKAKAKEMRRMVLEMIHRAKAQHIGCSFSEMEILVTLYYAVMNIDPYNPKEEDRDRFILSKGHGVSAVYAILADRGFFPKEYLSTYYQDGSTLAGHIVRDCVPGAETSNGSGGHGLSLGIGMALAARRKRSPARTFVLMGDGELQEGSVWEGITFAAFHKIGGLTLIIDKNELQIMGRTTEVLNMDPFEDKFKSFGWHVITLDGNDTGALLHAFRENTFDKPKVIIAHTIKGKGVSFIENRVEWHGKYPDEEQYRRALQELI